MPNPLRRDPSQTITLRTEFTRAFRVRLSELARRITYIVDTEDAFGLRLATNTRWKFNTDRGKVEDFRKWLKQQVDEGVLEVAEGFEDEPWTSPYVEDAYQKGRVRAVKATQKAAGVEEFSEGFLDSAFSGQTNTPQLETLFTRAFNELEGLTGDMQTRLTRTLAEGLGTGQGPREIARRLRKDVGISKMRAGRIARTEIVRSHAEGQLDGFEQVGMEEVTVMAEWSTAGDDKVCKLCSSLNGVVLTIKKARGLLPRHPNCRCAWIPAFPDHKEKGQVRGKTTIVKALRESVRAESPNRPVRITRRRSRWLGADLTKL